MSRRSLTGRWTGYYEQRNERRGIEAELFEQGDCLQGIMRDAQTEFETSVYEMAAECGLPPGADEVIVQALRHQFPESVRQPIRALMTLPDESQLQGKIQGRTVLFRKTYQGEAFSGYRVGEARVGVRVTGHAVEYRGALTEDDNQVEGIWWIEANPQRGVKRTEGAFVLRRISSEEE